MPIQSPEFTPAQPAATQANLGLTSENDAQNWMTQAAQRQQIGANTGDIQAQTAQRQAQTAQLNAVLPAIIAKGQADQLSAQNDIASATATQQMRGQFQSMKPQVIQDIAALHDPNNIPKEADGSPDWSATFAGMALWTSKKAHWPSWIWWWAACTAF